MASPFLRISGIVKAFGGIRAVDDVSLDVGKGELFCLLGGSGSGKSTLLRMLAGFETPDEGVIEIEGQDMARVRPEARPVNMMFQSYALFPHMRVAENVAYGLRQKGMGRAERDERVAEMLKLTRMSDFAARKPDQLSGGQRQRVALARALARNPKLLLLDEPLSALDKKLREETQFELMDIQDRLGTTFVVVTHDQEEAMTLATRIGVMDKGKLIQVDTPRRIYEFPKNRFIADFVGNINLLDATVTGPGRTDEIIKLHCPGIGTVEAACDDKEVGKGDYVTLAIRPEKIVFTKDLSKQGFDAEVDDLAYRGGVTQYRLRLTNGTMLTVTRTNALREGERPVEWEDKVKFDFAPQGALVLKD